ncbi:MAG: hypothetical protein KJ718_04910 [Nanoarchaeota archaeon]|nr:hypothetical protein [Nanoarchaeota archaeon]MBU1051866.1 hypothetical protein [Nanoarchaeota archaeon]MBU1988998.1 hypothetical protein [Nanoarchaeota archaeon]
MALGVSGSNGGIGEVYRRVVVADVDAGIRKYEHLLDGIPRDQETARVLYETALSGLRDLREKIVSEQRGD